MNFKFLKILMFAWGISGAPGAAFAGSCGAYAGQAYGVHRNNFELLN